MAKVLFLHPNKWGRGVTAIWIPSHAAVLKARGHEVGLFDCTFYQDWTDGENEYNTRNLQYRPTEYEQAITWKTNPVRTDLERYINAFRPDLIFSSAISSHIHGEGEYVSIQYAYELMASISSSAPLVCGGLQPTAAPIETFERFPKLSYLIRGESEFVLAELAESLASMEPQRIPGLIHKDGNESILINPPQPLIKDMDAIPPYDYSLFESQVFLRPYNGQVVRAVDYELSRGCPFTCSYCVETVIQRYYGFTEHAKRGAIKNPKGYMRHKSAGRIFDELERLYHDNGVTLVRAQDTNFLTIDRLTLVELANMIESSELPIRLYVETRPEGINSETIELMKRLQVDGVGMGIELATQAFREKDLNRFADQDKIIRAFEVLREAGIRRTAYNIIGLPGQDERSILETIEFNRLLDPDNITVAFYSPYLGTETQERAVEKSYFRDYEFNIDSQIRTVSRHEDVTPELLRFYKENFIQLVRSDQRSLDDMKCEYFGSR